MAQERGNRSLRSRPTWPSATGEGMPERDARCTPASPRALRLSGDRRAGRSCAGRHGWPGSLTERPRPSDCQVSSPRSRAFASSFSRTYCTPPAFVVGRVKTPRSRSTCSQRKGELLQLAHAGEDRQPDPCLHRAHPSSPAERRLLLRVPERAWCPAGALNIFNRQSPGYRRACSSRTALVEHPPQKPHVAVDRLWGSAFRELCPCALKGRGGQAVQSCPWKEGDPLLPASAPRHVSTARCTRQGTLSSTSSSFAYPPC